jgi:hypothetical protein
MYERYLDGRVSFDDLRRATDLAAAEFEQTRSGARDALTEPAAPKSSND